ncbi:hypothetical protein DK867_21275 [Ochrobactrum sp. POC9]|nr:hypothetical protein DK867_21275 [Ochrobactrum sp. POC9]
MHGILVAADRRAVPGYLLDMGRYGRSSFCQRIRQGFAKQQGQAIDTDRMAIMACEDLVRLTHDKTSGKEPAAWSCARWQCRTERDNAFMGGL